MQFLLLEQLHSACRPTVLPAQCSQEQSTDRPRTNHCTRQTPGRNAPTSNCLQTLGLTDYQLQTASQYFHRTDLRLQSSLTHAICLSIHCDALVNAAAVAAAPCLCVSPTPAAAVDSKCSHNKQAVRVGTQYASAPCELTIYSHLFARWHLFRHVGYLRNMTLKVASESRVTSMPILVFLDLSVLELRPTYATDRQTDRRETKASLNASALWVRMHNKLCGRPHNMPPPPAS